MALLQDDQQQAAPAFTWGSGGARLTPDEIAQRRKDAALLVQQGTDASPLPVGTRGWGVLTQGAARVAKALMGGLESREADSAAKANFDDNTKMRSDIMDAWTGKSAASPAVATVASAMLGGASPSPATTPTAVSSDAPRGIRNNNPLNIEDGDFAKSQPGYAGTDGRFAKFETPEHGTAAASNLLDVYQTKHGLNTVGGIVNRWAPAGDGNNVSAYASTVAKQLGISPDTPLKPEQRSALIAAMSKYENGVPVQVASADSSFVPGAAAPAPAPVAKVAPSPAISQVAAALSPATVAGAQYPSPLQTNAIIPGFPASVDNNIRSMTTDPDVAGKLTADPSDGKTLSAFGPGVVFYDKNGSRQRTYQNPNYSGNSQVANSTAVPGALNIPGMSAPSAMTPQAPVPFTGQLGFVPPIAAVAQAAPAVAAKAAPAPADDDEEDTPPNATPAQGVLPANVAKVAAAMPGAAPTTAAASPPSVAPVQAGIHNVNPGVLRALTSPYADDATKKIAGIVLQQQMTPKEVHAQTTDKDGNVYDVNRLTGERKVILKADGDPTSVKEYNFYKGQLPPGQQPMPYDVWSTAKARAAATNVTTNVDTNSGQTYDKQLAEGLGKAHATLANGVEDAQSRARDIAAMQGAVDQIQKNGGTTGGMAPAARLELQKSINAGATALGIDKPFSEADISDKEFLTKFNRSMAGAQAKNAVGSRVTNFEMSNFLKANPGLDMSVTGNQRLLGIQAQIEQRNIAVGNSIREATAQAISGGKKIDPVTVQRIITDYDAAHHIQDPTTGQDLTQSYVLPEFQNAGTNVGLSGQHNSNMGPNEKAIGGKTYEKRSDGHWYEKQP